MDMDTGETLCDKEDRNQSDASTSQGTQRCQGTTGHWGRDAWSRPALMASEGTNGLILNFQPLLFKPPSVGHFVTATPANCYTPSIS